MAIQIHIIGVDKDGEQIDEVFGDCVSAIDYMQELNEYDHLQKGDWEEENKM